MRQLLLLTFVAISALLLPELALAHPDHSHSHALSSAQSSFFAGWAHPWTGADHLLALCGVALWSVQLGGSFRRLLPLTFVAAMGAGLFLGSQFGALPLVEGAIVLSLVVIGGLVMFEHKFSELLSIAIVALFASMHGAAHGIELPLGANILPFAVGALAAASTILLLGNFFLGAIFSGRRSGVRIPISRAPLYSLRALGAAIALSPLLIA